MPPHNSDRNRAWGKWVKDKRNAQILTRKELADLAQMDASYITLIERDGYVPRRPFVTRIGMALGDANGALVAAGFIPPEMSSRIREFMRCPQQSKLPGDIAPTVRKLAESTTNVRRQAVAVIEALLSEKPKKRKKEVTQHDS